MGGIDPDFDVSEFCKNLRNSKAPPYQCPVADCLKRYRTICGLQYHLKNHDHANPTAPTTPAKKSRKKGRHGNKTVAKTQDLLQPIARETLTYAEAQKVVEFEVESRVIRVGIEDPIIIMSKENYEEKYGTSDAKEGKPIPRLDPIKPDEQKIKLPEPSFTILENYNIADAPPRPTNAYIRFIERSADELDCEVEYDLDEEDCAWLAIMNEGRAESGLPPVSVDVFELLMDRLEKESYFQMANMKSADVGPSDDDAVCCICMDGECQNSNVILFCDMCNLAVHQDCYGVPYIPEGQWHCRRCIQSPSTAVDCVLCPNTGGAFKQTDRSNWAHVVCALWIPEVRFANTVFLEPIDSIETIPPARWKLTCYICKQRGVGACIQCHKNNCYAAFHVTCAQQAGLFMKMDTVKDNVSAVAGELAPVMVQKTAYCDGHTPADAETRPRLPLTLAPPAKVGKASKVDTKLKMKKARRILAKNRTAVPVISIPTIPPDRIQEIGSLVTLQKKTNFIQRLIAYWTLKRQFRNGVPLLRRLQTTHFSRRDDGKLSTELDEIYRQMKYLKCLRQDLEKARLLCELVRKREKKKNELTRAKEACILVELCPLQYFLTRIWEQISSRDSNAIFMEPVDTNEVPDYSDVVTHPMDLSTMKAKIDEMKYLSIAEFEVDFKLMINNCLTYNSKDTIFYRAGLKMKEQGLAIIQNAQCEAQQAGIEGVAVASVKAPTRPPPTTSSDSNSEISDPAPKLIQKELAILQAASSTMSLDDQMKKLITLADLAQSVKSPTTRNRKCRIIKSEMTKLKKIISKTAKAIPQLKTPTKVASEVRTPESASKSIAKPVTEALPPVGTVREPEDADVDSSSSEDKPLKPVPVKTPTKNEVKRRRSGASASDNKKQCKEEVANKEREDSHSEHRTPTKTTTPSESTTASPSGVNRRTAVLFTRKAQAVAFKKPSTSSTDTTASPATSVSSSKRRVGRPRRNLDAAASALTASDPPMPTSDSFRIYRSGGDIPQETDDETPSDDSSCTSCSGSDSSCSSSVSSSDGELGGGVSSSGDEATVNASQEPLLEPLTLVWAKCRGYPWYPALIINPKMPRDYIHNGVPIPAPPADVLALANSYTEPVYLVLFFDAKRTWQWLPRNKLELLGITDDRDEAKLTESRKPTDRKAVRKAFTDALQHRCQVTQTSSSDVVSDAPAPEKTK